MSWNDPDDLHPLNIPRPVSKQQLLDAALRYVRAIDAYDREWHLHPARSARATELRLERLHAKWALLQLKTDSELEGQRKIFRKIREIERIRRLNDDHSQRSKDEDEG